MRCVPLLLLLGLSASAELLSLGDEIPEEIHSSTSRFQTSFRSPGAASRIRWTGTWGSYSGLLDWRGERGELRGGGIWEPGDWTIAAGQYEARRGGLLEENRRSRPSLDSSVSPASSLPRLFPVPASRAGEISLALGHSRALLLLVEGSPEVYLGAKSTLLHYRKTGRPDCPLFSLSKRFQEEGRELSLEFVRAGLRKEWAEALEIRGILPLGDSRLSYSSLLLRGTLPEESTGMGLLSLGSGLESKVHLRIRTAFIKGTLALRYREGAGLGLGKRRLEACAGTRIQATRFSLRLLREREEEDQSGLAAFPRVEILESLDWEFQCRTQSRGLRLRGRRGFESPSVLLSFDGKESVAGLDYGLIFYSNAEGVPDFRSLEGAPLLPRPIMLRGRGARLSLKTQHSLRRWQLRSALALDTEFRFSFTLLLQSKSRDDGASRN